MLCKRMNLFPVYLIISAFALTAIIYYFTIDIFVPSPEAADG